MTSSSKSPKYINLDGFILGDAFTPELFRSALTYKPRADDVFVVTYPKCGCTWMCQMVLLILKKGDTSIFNSAPQYMMACPFLEFVGTEFMDMMDRPGCIKTHLPFNSLPYTKDAKYIYVARHPRDCVVSYYHHTRHFPTYRFTNGTFDEYFELFVNGEVDYNDYFDHLLSWYERRNEPNVFFTTYEAMKADHRGTVLKLAEFLGEEYSAALRDNELLEKVIHCSSLNYMKKEVNKLYKGFERAQEENEMQHPLLVKLEECYKAAIADGHRSIGDFVRNGMVGEGKTVLSPEQEKKLQTRILEKTKGSDVMSLWQEI